VALDNDNPNSETSNITPYLLNNGISIDDSSDDEYVSNLMQDVDNLSKVSPFNILDTEAKTYQCFSTRPS
jgi:hypothetical protein